MSRTRAADLSLFSPMPGIKRGPAVITAGPLKAVWADFAVRSLLPPDSGLITFCFEGKGTPILQKTRAESDG